MNHLQVAIEGAIGESTPFFLRPLKEVVSIDLDMSKVTYINSVGVKQWILWTMKIPKGCIVTLRNCPYVIVSQAGIVLGFITPNMRIASFRAPYICEDCGFEEVRLLEMGKDYFYSTATEPKRVHLNPDNICVKCKSTNVEHDFLIDKTFKFLS